MSAATLKPRKPRSRLGRLATLPRLAAAFTWVFRLAVVVAVLQVILALTRSGTLAEGWDSQPGPPPLVCLIAARQLLQHAGIGLSHPGLSPGVEATWNTASVCTAHPTVGQALAFAVTLLPIGLLRLGALYLVMRLARTAARDGVYTVQAARLVLILGWWLLAGGLVAVVAEAFARVNLLGQLVTWHVGWGLVGAAGSVSWPVVWFGLGLIVFARVMRTGAGMRADLEGTV